MSAAPAVFLVVAALAGLALAYSWHAHRGELARRQALDLALQACRARAELLSQMGHELRASLNVIGGMGELLARTPLSAGQKDYVAAIQRSSAQLLRMIEDLLDASWLEESAPSPLQTGFSLATLVGETARALAPHAEEKGLTLVCDVDPGLPDAVCGDPERLRRVLEKLLRNAIKLSERGEVVLRVHPEADERRRDLVKFSVSNSGVGIPNEGLGFAIPLAPDPSSPPAADGGVSLRGLRALVLESGTVEREALGTLLRSLGLEPTLVAEADAAVEELHRAAREARPYAVVLLDSTIRGSAAFRARRKEDDPVLAGTPRVRLWTQTRLAAAAQDPGPRVLKPVTRADLLAAIQQALRGEIPTAGIPAPSEETGRRARADRACVLVVDENPVRALVTSRMVELAGGETVVTARPDAVDEALAARTIALVVLDTARPEHRNCEARLRESHPGLAVVHAPVGEAELRTALARIRREPPPSPTGNEAPLDRPRLVRNLGDDEQAADQVLSAFVAQAGDSLDSLRGACASGDLPGIARAAHRLKGSLMWIGADRAAREVGSLESRANAGDADGARTILAVVEGEVRAVVAAIRDTPAS